ncbi:DUF4430 domain-containing protein [Desulfotomaculum sp. 1211_IL3151]|uniref:DUF4430 domain-containing protein n=1 Tax=Desulfotomaculum sp. 1211_IL3151 TaxID=3084055 RepID=UPI002FD95353
MKGKTKVILLLFVILAFLLGPAVYSNKISSVDQTKVSSQATPLNNVLETEVAAKDESITKNMPEVKKETEDKTSANAVPTNNQQGEIIPQNNTNQEKAPPVSQAVVTEAAAVTGGSASVTAQSQGNITSETEENQLLINLAVVGMNGELLYGPSSVTVSQPNQGVITVLEVLDASGIEYTMSSRYPGLVESIVSQRNRGQGGWMYKINDQSPMQGASKMAVKKGDTVIWWYSQSIRVPPPQWEQLMQK